MTGAGGDGGWVAIRTNLFPAAHAAITDWETFPWHRDSRGAIHSHKPHSSQALAIDVFGTLGAVTDERRTRVCDALAAAAGLSPGGPWQVKIEWCDPANHLAEKRATQVDALLVGANAIIVAECKFTEPGGGCSQTKRITRGQGAGLPQCNGRYAPQVNPANGVAASCALTGKGIRYWDVVPALFALDMHAEHDPCPFRGEAFQWMRNMALAAELGRTMGKAARCLIVHATGGDFPTERKIRDHSWLPPLRAGTSGPLGISYQQLVTIAAEADADGPWAELGDWVNRKIRGAATRAGQQEQQHA